jgi:SAM-dependent methyltransferase
VVVGHCQICNSTDLDEVLFIGYLPPVNQMRPIGERPHEQPGYPALWLRCPRCQLVQLGLIVDPKILFPPEYPYTSSTTKILRENFTELYRECITIIKLESVDLIVDIGSNDGNLLSNFKENHRVLGVTPEDIGKIAVERGIPTIFDYFTRQVAVDIRSKYGRAKVVTATNVFAHIENINDILESVLDILTPDGMFISESHYLISLLETLQYDTIYHEHLRYYSLHSLKYLLDSHGLEIVHTKRIPTHGGSIRVYAARKGQYPIQTSVQDILKEEKNLLSQELLMDFKRKVVHSKLQLYALLLDIKNRGQRVYGIGAPSRASTLINYVGLDDGIIDCVLEVEGSHKTGKYMPGTLIPVLGESKLFEDQPEFALLFSWHIAEELMPKLKAKGFKGDFIIPLPEPRIIAGKDI